MDAAVAQIAAVLLPIAQEGGKKEESGNFLVSPNVGLMIWTLLAFGLTLLLLRRLAFPRIQAQLDKRRRAIEESIDHAESTRREADKILEEYRARLSEAREQAEDIVVRARRAADRVAEDSRLQAQQDREAIMEQTRRDIERETQRAIQEIRKEVADLTVMATEKVTRKSLTPEDHKRLIDEALEEADFTALAPSDDGRNGGGEDR